MPARLTALPVWCGVLLRYVIGRTCSSVLVIRVDVGGLECSDCGIIHVV